MSDVNRHAAETSGSGGRFLTRNERLGKIKAMAGALELELRQVARHPDTNPEWADEHVEALAHLHHSLGDIEEAS